MKNILYIAIILFLISCTHSIKYQIEELTRKINIEPNDGEAYYNRGKLYEESIEYYNKSLELKPDYSDAYNNRGSCYFYLGDYRNAIRDFEKCLEIDDSNDNASLFLNYSYDRLGDKEETVRYYTKKIEIDSNDYDAYRGRYRALFKLERFSECAADMNQCLRLNPEGNISKTLRKKIRDMGFEPEY